MSVFTQKPRITILIALLAGLALGYSAAWWQYHPPGPLLQLAQARLPVVESPAAMVADVAVPMVLPVQLADANDIIIASTRGLLIAPGDRLVLPLSALHHARRGVFRLGEQVFPLGKVVGLNDSAGLVTVETGLPAGRPGVGLTLAGSVSLYLGLDLEMLSLGETLDGWVDTAAQQGMGSQIVYGVRSHSSRPLLFDQPEQVGLIPLMLPGTRTLAGVMTGRQLDTGLYEAVDASALSVLAAPLATHNGPVSIAGFSQFFFTQTTAGRLFSFKFAAAREDWARVIELGPALLTTSSGDQEVVEILERGYLEEVRAALDNRDITTALQTLDVADAVLQPSAALAHARANSLHVGNRNMEALDILYSVIDAGLADNTTYALVQNLVLMLIDNDRLSHGEKQSLLEQAIAREPAVAFYHAELGESFYRQGRYADALTQLNYAVQLDAGLHSELQALMNNARARLQTPDQVIVSLSGDGNAYYIDTAINGASRQLLLDTGASFTAISGSLARELGFTIPQDAPRVQLSTANGLITAPMVTLDSISVNGATVANLDVVVIENMGGNGLLGLNFLNHFNIDIDQSNSEMTLRRR